MEMMTQTAHRPWPLPEGPWIMAQTWNDLLFAHWPVSADLLAPFIPAGLAIDRFEGEAWLGVVPFWMSGVRPRYVPSLPYFSRFAELNVRTYVVAGGKPGVLFLSLDAANPVAVAAARRWFHLPYFNAAMSVQEERGTIRYSSRRIHRGAPEAVFTGSYRPTSPVFTARPGTLEHWLTERYCLYTADRHGNLLRGEIHHQPWPLQWAEAEIEQNSMAACHGLTLPDTKPLLHFSKTLQTRIWGLRRV